MKNGFPLFLLLMGLNLWTSGCADAQPQSVPETKVDTIISKSPLSIFTVPIYTSKKGSMTDPRDGEIYATITIGRQTWMAENLRYDIAGSMINPDNPSKAYGRLYELIAAQTACPKGWHLPSDVEWDEVEMAHGMPASFIGEGGWRGEHATNMKSVAGWGEDGNGINSLGFNILPAGYYFSDKISDEPGLEGLGFSAAYWSAMEGNKGWARFLFSSRKFINKWADEKDETGSALSCRCVKD